MGIMERNSSYEGKVKAKEERREERKEERREERKEAKQEARKDKTITRADLSEDVYRRIGLSRKESADLVDSLFQSITDGILKTGYVKISSFGAFFVRQRKPRIGRNPKTGEITPIPARRVLLFRPSRQLKDRIKKP